MQTYEVLERALNLIEDEKNWCQGTAYDRDGSMCMAGALDRAEFGAYCYLDEHPVYRAVVGAIPRLPNIPVFNDSHSHAEVVALFHRVIQQEKAKAGIYVELPEKLAEHA